MALSGSTTNADGVVSFQWTLGSVVGAQRVELLSDGVAALSVEAVATPRPEATQLVFTAGPPSTLVAGASGALLTVEARDAEGALVTEFADSVTLTYSAGPDGGVVLGTTTVAAVNGVASFDAWRIERVGTYTLVATAGARAPAVASQLQVTAAPAAVLRVLRGDGQTAQVGQVLADPLVLRVTDAFANGVPAVTLGVTVSEGGGTLSAASVTTDAQGEATLPEWTLGTVVGLQSLVVSGPGGLSLQLTATATALPPPVANRTVVITQEPGAAQVAGVPVTPALVATVTLPGGAVDALFTDTLALLVVAGPGETSVVGTARVAAVAGVATFDAWQVERAGTEFRVQVSGPDVVPDTSAAFSVAAAPAASLTVLSGAGQSALAGTTLPVLIQVRVQDAFLNPRAGDTVYVALSEPVGALAGTYAVTDASGTAVLPAWTLGSPLGVQTIVVTVAGLDAVEIAATATAPSPATALVITQAPDSVQVAGGSFTPALVVQLRDAGGAVVTSFTDSVDVALASGSAAGSLQGRRRVAAVAGVATFDSLQVRLAGLGYRLAVSAGALLTPDTTAAIAVVAAAPDSLLLLSGGGQSAVAGDTLLAPIRVRVADAYGNAVVGATVTFAVATGAGTLTGAAVLTDTLGVSQLGRWQLGPTAGVQSITATVGALAPLSISATATPPPPVIELSVVGSNVVGFERAGTLQVRLLQPAPAGGVTVSVISDSTQRLTIAAPGTVTFAAGQTIGTIAVSGISLGPAVVRAEAAGYVPDTLVVPVSLNLLSTPATLTVPLAQSRSLPINLSTAAPAGGVYVRVTSSAPDTVRVLTDSVFVAAGSVVANATVEGLLLGAATLTVTNPNYAPFTSTATVSAALNIEETSVALNASFGRAFTVRLEPSGSTVFAPTGGVAITFTSDDPTCVATPAPRVIGAGESAVTDTARYGGSATLPCTTRLRVTGPAGFAVDSMTATVAVAPGISAAAMSLGSGLMRSASASLGANNHGGTTITLRSLDPSKVRLSRTAAEVGDSVVTLTVAPLATTGSYVVHAMEGITADTIGIAVEAEGFVSATQSVRVWRPVIDLQNVVTTATTLTADRVIYAQIGTPFSPTGDFVNTADAVRRGSPGIPISFISDAVSVLRVQSTATGEVDSLALVIPAGSTITPTSVAAGGAALRYVGEGVGTVRVASPQARSITPSTRTVTVSAPALSFGSMNVGSGLQRSASVSLGAPAPAGGLAVRITANTLGVVLFAPTVSTIGTDTLVVTVPAGQSSASFVVQALEGFVGDTIQLLATAPGFTPTSGPIRVFQAVQEFYNWPTTATSQSTDRVIYASVGTPSNQAGTFISTSDAVRFGGPGMTVSFISDSASVGTLVTTAGVADSVALVLAPGSFNSPTTLAAGGVAYRYLNAGVGVVRSVIPGVRALAGATRSVTVTAPAVSPALINVGSGLQRLTLVSLGAPAPVGGVSVTLKASVAGRILLAPNVVTVGSTDSLVVTIPAGSTSANYVVQSVDGIIADTVQVIATAPGFRTDSAAVRIWQPVHEISGLGTSYNTLSADVAFRVFVGTPGSPTGTFVNSFDSRRFGADPFTYSVVTSVPTVGQLVTTARTGDTVMVQVLAGTNGSAASVATGGVAFDPLSTGSTAVTVTSTDSRALSGAARTVSVIPPRHQLWLFPHPTGGWPEQRRQRVVVGDAARWGGCRHQEQQPGCAACGAERLHRGHGLHRPVAGQRHV